MLHGATDSTARSHWILEAIWQRRPPPNRQAESISWSWGVRAD